MIDTDQDGIQDGGETGYDGATVNLYDSNDQLVASTTTAGGGYYSFTNLPAGDYYLEFVLPGGYVFSPSNQGGDDDTDSDASSTNGLTQ